ncbi:MarR family transcriptional regulator [Serratia sp. PAMC26656]|uniref:MarR family winged helix-turn-helix transcriptional regulator n=1 Tax=Serratia sp. PAMC26656 TaxID=2775909 RepID=UPI0018F7A463|nr:MarR family transcriptional regulator [Serratia sp. PAMC26656]
MTVSEGQLDWTSVSAFSGPQKSPGFTLWRDFMRWQRELNAQLRPLGLTQPQFAVLAVCGWMTRNAEEVTQQEIVDFLGLDRMHISQIATRLEENGLIERPAATADTRAKRILLTAKGRELLIEAMPLVEEFDRKFFT